MAQWRQGIISSEWQIAVALIIARLRCTHKSLENYVIEEMLFFCLFRNNYGRFISNLLFWFVLDLFFHKNYFKI